MTDVDVTLRVQLGSTEVEPSVPVAFSVSDEHPFTILVPRQDGTWQPVTVPAGPVYILDAQSWRRITNTAYPSGVRAASGT